MHGPQRSWRLTAVAGIAGLLLVACAADGTNPSPSDVDPSTEPTGSDAVVASGAPSASAAPLAFTEGRTTELLGATLIDVTYPSAGGGAVSAWLVVPDGEGPFAGLLYLHGSETDRNDLVDEAAAMAAGGAVSLVIDAPFAREAPNRTGFIPNWFEPEAEAVLTEQTLDDLRRGIDLLVARGDVDAERIGFVGHSWGASLGAHLATADERVTASVLVTGRPSWTGFLRQDEAHWTGIIESLGEDGWETYLTTMAAWDAVEAIGDVDPATVYLQFGTEDDVVGAGHVEEWVEAAPANVRLDRYEAGHALDAAATADRVAWLSERLGLDAVPAEIVAEVGLPDATTLIP